MCLGVGDSTELSLASGSLLDSPAGSAPGMTLLASQGCAWPAAARWRLQERDRDDDDHEDYHRILLLDGCSPLGMVCCASASTVPLEVGVLGHIQRDGYLPGRGANTRPMPA